MPPVSKDKKCINPWYGYLALLCICVLMAGGIFLQFGSKQKGPVVKHRGVQTLRREGGLHATQAAWTPNVADAGIGEPEMIVF